MSERILQIEERERPTIMDGKVITFATDFEERDGPLGKRHEARGPFKVSASRNAVIVHRATIETEEELDALLRALKTAMVRKETLR